MGCSNSAQTGEAPATVPAARPPAVPVLGTSPRANSAALPEESTKLPELKIAEPGTTELGTKELAVDQTEEATGGISRDALPPVRAARGSRMSRMSVEQFGGSRNSDVRLLSCLGPSSGAQLLHQTAVSEYIQLPAPHQLVPPDDDPIGTGWCSSPTADELSTLSMTPKHSPCDAPVSDKGPILQVVRRSFIGDTKRASKMSSFYVLQSSERLEQLTKALTPRPGSYIASPVVPCVGWSPEGGSTSDRAGAEPSESKPEDEELSFMRGPRGSFLRMARQSKLLEIDLDRANSFMEDENQLDGPRKSRYSAGAPKMGAMPPRLSFFSHHLANEYTDAAELHEQDQLVAEAVEQQRELQNEQPDGSKGGAAARRGSLCLRTDEQAPTEQAETDLEAFMAGEAGAAGEAAVTVTPSAVAVLPAETDYTALLANVPSFDEDDDQMSPIDLSSPVDAADRSGSEATSDHDLAGHLNELMRGFSVLSISDQAVFGEEVLNLDEPRSASISDEEMTEALKWGLPCTEGSGQLKVSHDRGFTLKVGWVSQTGYYPDQLGRETQDCWSVNEAVGGDELCHLVGVYDGHGKCGDACSQFAAANLFHALEESGPLLHSNPCAALRQAYIKVNTDMHDSANVNDQLSGTTAICALLKGTKMYVSCAGDSRAVLGCEDDNGTLLALDLSCDHNPWRPDELARVEACGAIVLTSEQVSGEESQDYKPWTEPASCLGDKDNRRIVTNVDDEMIPRLWLSEGFSKRQGHRPGKIPGCAFTRSLGDSMAETIGVVAEPEVVVHHLCAERDRFIVVASDGVFEFLTSQEVVNIVGHFDDPVAACDAVTQEAFGRWLQLDGGSDDITCIVLQVHVAGATKSFASSTKRTQRRASRSA